jgi:hypothetical protein
MTSEDWLSRLISESLDTSVWGALEPLNVERVRRKNASKTHFIPLGVRVFSGVVQAMNIRYGNFIQAVMNALVAREPSLKLHPSSGRRVDFRIPGSLDAVVDNYITQRKRSSSVDPDNDYSAMRGSWLASDKSNLIASPNDVDLLFRDSSGQMTYVELKFNDDHDTGKHPDIFRKLIKTGLAIEVQAREPVLPCVYFFNPGERKLVKFLPDEQRLFGQDFFQRYLTIDYKEVADALSRVSIDTAIKKKFIDFFLETVEAPKGDED